MAVRITGQLYDFRSTVRNDLYPELVFEPIRPTITGRFKTNLHFTNPVVAKIVDQATGYFTVDLEPYTEMTFPTGYNLKIRWLDKAGNFVREDYWPEEIWVNAGGGNIGDQVKPQNTYSNMYVFAQATEPDPWPRGTYWLDTISGDLFIKE